jgi:hypothetical protein
VQKVLDSVNVLSGICWNDDCQISDGRTLKVQAAPDEKPHVVIVIRPKGEILPGLDSMI